MEKTVMFVTGPVPLLPKMKAAGVTDEQIRCILVDNPRRFFGG